MLLSITHEIPGKFNKDWLPKWTICMIKDICEVNTLTLQTYNTLQNQRQTHCGTLYHWITRVQGLRRQYLMDIPSHTIMCLKFPGFLIRFPLALKYHVPGSTFWSATDSLKTISHVSLLIRVLFSSSIALKSLSVFSPDKVSIYVGVLGSWLWDLIT